MAKNLLLNILKATAIVFTAQFLMVLVGLVAYYKCGITVRAPNFGFRAATPTLPAVIDALISYLLPCLLVLGALYLPAKIRTFVAVGALLLYLGCVATMLALVLGTDTCKGRP